VLRSGRRRDTDFNSFPSGHTAGAVAVAVAVGRDYPGGRLPALALAAAAGIAQVVRSKHYVSDVVAGATIGIVAELAIDRLIRKAARI
jgi:undecaprenyl-diphosphatase